MWHEVHGLYLRIGERILLQPLVGFQCWDTRESDFIRKNLASINPNDQWRFLIAARNDLMHLGTRGIGGTLNFVHWDRSHCATQIQGGVEETVLAK